MVADSGGDGIRVGGWGQVLGDVLGRSEEHRPVVVGLVFGSQAPQTQPAGLQAIVKVLVCSNAPFPPHCRLNSSALIPHPLCRCLRQLFPALCRLRSLSLALCGGLEDEGAAHLALAPCLHNLDLHCCWRLTDAGTHSVLSSSSSLRQVNVDGCPRLTLAACPHDWVALDSLVGGSEMKSSGSGGSTHKRPGLLVRVPQ
jgi:hypothetical protein